MVANNRQTDRQTDYVQLLSHSPWRKIRQGQKEKKGKQDRVSFALLIIYSKLASTSTPRTHLKSVVVGRDQSQEILMLGHFPVSVTGGAFARPLLLLLVSVAPPGTDTLSETAAPRHGRRRSSRLLLAHLILGFFYTVIFQSSIRIRARWAKHENTRD